MFTQIWERYFLKEFCKIFFLFLFCFYGLYVIIDYANRASALSHHVHIPFMDTVKYYSFVFASRSEILLPFALLLATIKTLGSFNTHYELVALMAGGFRLHRLMRPFIFVGIVCMCLIFINEQFVLPTALKKLRRIEDATKHQKSRRHLEMAVNHAILEDGSLFLFQNYDTAKEQFFDAYWIPSTDQFYRMKYFSPYAEKPTGYFVDQIVRRPNGNLELANSYPEYAFKKMHFSQEMLHSTIMDPDMLSLTELWGQLPSNGHEWSEKESKVSAAFYWKLFIPFLCLIAIMAPAPYCVRFSRQYPFFFIYVCGLFGLIAFYLVLDAAQVIARRQVASPLLAIGIPFWSVFTISSWRFAKMK